MKKYNNIAIIAFIFSICCIVIPFVGMLLPPIPVILAIIAKRHEEQLSQQSRSFVKAAMIIGTIALFVVSFSITMVLFNGLLPEGFACAIGMVVAIVLAILSVCLYSFTPKRVIDTSEYYYDFRGYLTRKIYTYSNLIYGHIIGDIGKIPLNEITQSELQQF